MGLGGPYVVACIGGGDVSIGCGAGEGVGVVYVGGL
jgi:hypothetical protein